MSTSEHEAAPRQELLALQQPLDAPDRPGVLRLEEAPGEHAQPQAHAGRAGGAERAEVASCGVLPCVEVVQS
jgi:hypothetical protein